MRRPICVKQGFTIVRNISFSIAYYDKKWRQFTKYIVAGLTLVLLYTTLSSCSPSLPKLFDMTTSEAATTIIPPLSTRGSAIIDAKGRVVLLRGVNWFGMELKEHTPHGLWVRDYKDMLAQIKSLGYNVIRLPYSVQALRSRDISGVDFFIGANKDFQGKTPIEVMDIIIQEAQRQGLFIILDSHTLKDGKIPELWYDDAFSEKDWIDTWTLLAKRYKGYINVIGADLKNEPHGRASWGTGDKATDWRLAAERAGNKILSVNPKWLILVEGVVGNVPGQKQPIYAWGANLEGVLKYPVRLKVPKKLVYSPHEYAASHLPWVKEPILPGNLYKRLEIGFHYIATQGIAPILIGEFGGLRVDTKSREGIWHRLFVDYIDKKKLSFTYWCWNPNSGDTGGLLLDDWKSINTDKQKLLSQLLG
ncbi:MAG: glycoside hydrolase family 5 protein [Scytonema sp. RU_4_4]|nr:glycoside hydrolase family 5 protein [Scytonema sp. RU_4_4]NJR74721.1 glycoside hydrolase family 5 protein [Scytonema sp. CRU_2_7]